MSDRPFWRGLIEAAEQTNDISYARVVSDVSETLYRERVARMGFEDMGRVLDLGCGFGQWSWALSARNAHVVAMEIHEKRLGITRRFMQAKGRTNVSVVRGDGNRLPFADASFDAVFCYGVFMFMPIETARAEIERVLVPGGRAFLCTNGPGWWASLVVKHLRDNANVRDAARKAFSNGIGGGVPSSISRDDVAAVFPAPTWTVIETAAEGRLAGGGPELASYEPTYFGLDNVIDLIVEKAVADPAQARASRQADFLMALLDNTLAKQTYSYRGGALDHIQPRPVLDVTYNAETERIARVRDNLAGLDRPPILKAMFDRITQGAADDFERLRRVVTFAQLHFYHHFGGQIVRPNGSLVFDPLEAFVLRNARCGSVARWIIDVMATAGFSGRLLAAACHTTAEIEIGGRWCLADASLYPPGVMPLNRAGGLLTFDEAVADPNLLDRVPNYINYETGSFTEIFEYYPELCDANSGYFFAPILPSTGYAGDLWATAGRVIAERYQKRRSAELDDPLDYGWFNYSTLAGDQPAVPTRQRPQQVSNLRTAGGLLQWDAGVPSPNAGATTFRIFASPTSRGWRYDHIPVGCDFALPGAVITTAQPQLPLSDLPAGTRFVSIVAAAEDLREDVFYLPSDEMALDGGAS